MSPPKFSKAPATGIPCFSACTTRFIVSALATITYMLVCGYTPFHADTTTIPNPKIEFQSPYWNPISDQARHSQSTPSPTRLYVISGLPTRHLVLMSSLPQDRSGVRVRAANRFAAAAASRPSMQSSDK